MFRNREDAGRQLAERLAVARPDRPVVLALPRGGVPVALPVARTLEAPLDLLMVRKLGMPGHGELAAGAVVDGAEPQTVFNTRLLRSAGLSADDFKDQVAQKLREIDDRRARYLGGRAPVAVAGRTAIVVDDGIATGATMRAALKALARRSPAHIVLAVPVAPADTLAELAPLVDEAICLETPDPFYAVGAHYHDFEQVGDEQVTAGLKRARGPQENGNAGC